MRYAWRAETIYDIHAPLAFGFVGEVIEDRRHFYAHDHVAALRRRYSVDATARRMLDDDAAVPNERYGRYLTSLADWRGARRVLELGSGLGVGSCCLAAGMAAGGHLLGVEPNARLAAYAKTALAQTVPYARAEVLVGSYAARLDEALASLGGVDVALVNTPRGATPLSQELLGRVISGCQAGGVLVVGGVHQSAQAEDAWAWLRSRPEVTLSFDLYQWGVCIVDPSIRVPQHHVLVPWRWKPWHMGFFKSRR